MELSRFHPLSVFIYYICAFVLLMLFPHPLLLSIAFFILCVGAFLEDGFKNALKSILGNLILAAFCIIINPLVNHRGPTTLFMLGSMRITLEATLYGLNMALVLVTCIRLFLSFCRVMTSVKIMTLLSGKMPSLALVFSMMLRLVPVVKNDAKELKKYQGVNVRSIGMLTSITLEDGVIRSISMNDRGYGGKRTSLYRSRLHMRDMTLIIISVLILAGAIALIFSGIVFSRFFPAVNISAVPVYVLVPYCLFFIISLRS